MASSSGAIVGVVILLLVIVALLGYLVLRPTYVVQEWPSYPWRWWYGDTWPYGVYAVSYDGQPPLRHIGNGEGGHFERGRGHGGHGREHFADASAKIWSMGGPALPDLSPKKHHEHPERLYFADVSGEKQNNSKIWSMGGPTLPDLIPNNEGFEPIWSMGGNDLPNLLPDSGTNWHARVKIQKSIHDVGDKTEAFNGRGHLVVLGVPEIPQAIPEIPQAVAFVPQAYPQIPQAVSENLELGHPDFEEFAVDACGNKVTTVREIKSYETGDAVAYKWVTFTAALAVLLGCVGYYMHVNKIHLLSLTKVKRR